MNSWEPRRSLFYRLSQGFLHIADSSLPRLFFGQSVRMDHCSMFCVLPSNSLLFLSASVEMCKVEKRDRPFTWHGQGWRFFSVFLPSMIRNFSPCVSRFLASFHGFSWLFIRQFLFQVVLCLLCLYISNLPKIIQLGTLSFFSGAPRKHTKDSFLTLGNIRTCCAQQLHMAACTCKHTGWGCTVCSFIFKVRFGAGFVFTRIASCFHYLPLSWDQNTC